MPLSKVTNDAQSSIGWIDLTDHLAGRLRIQSSCTGWIVPKHIETFIIDHHDHEGCTPGGTDRHGDRFRRLRKRFLGEGHSGRESHDQTGSVIDPATFTAGQTPPPWAMSSGGGRWVGMRLEVTDVGPEGLGTPAETRRYQPTLEFPTDRNFLTTRMALPLDIVGCPALKYYLLPGTTTTGCVAIEIRPGSSLRTLDVVLAFGGLGGDTRPIAEWSLPQVEG